MSLVNVDEKMMMQNTKMHTHFIGVKVYTLYSHEKHDFAKSIALTKPDKCMSCCEKESTLFY